MHKECRIMCIYSEMRWHVFSVSGIPFQVHVMAAVQFSK